MERREEKLKAKKEAGELARLAWEETLRARRTEMVLKVQVSRS